MTGQEEKKSADEKPVSEDEAMLAFSSAKLNGVKIMDLPDQDPSKAAKEKMNEQQEMAVFQANEIEKQKQEEQKTTQ